jgi:hypothetical protein
MNDISAGRSLFFVKSPGFRLLFSVRLGTRNTMPIRDQYLLVPKVLCFPSDFPTSIIDKDEH